MNFMELSILCVCVCVCIYIFIFSPSFQFIIFKKLCSFKKTFIDKVHLYHEVDDDHHITFEDGTSKTIGKTLTNEGLVIFKMFFFK